MADLPHLKMRRYQFDSRNVASNQNWTANASSLDMNTSNVSEGRGRSFYAKFLKSKG